MCSMKRTTSPRWTWLGPSCSCASNLMDGKGTAPGRHSRTTGLRTARCSRSVGAFCAAPGTTWCSTATPPSTSWSGPSSPAPALSRPRPKLAAGIEGGGSTAGDRRRGGAENRLDVVVGEEDPAPEEPIAPVDEPVRCDLSHLPVQHVVHSRRREQVLQRLEPDRRAKPWIA